MQNSRHHSQVDQLAGKHQDDSDAEMQLEGDCDTDVQGGTKGPPVAQIAVSCGDCDMMMEVQDGAEPPLDTHCGHADKNTCEPRAHRGLGACVGREEMETDPTSEDM